MSSVRVGVSWMDVFDGWWMWVQWGDVGDFWVFLGATKGLIRDMICVGGLSWGVYVCGWVVLSCKGFLMFGNFVFGKEV